MCIFLFSTTDKKSFFFFLPLTLLYFLHLQVDTNTRWAHETKSNIAAPCWEFWVLELCVFMYAIWKEVKNEPPFFKGQWEKLQGIDGKIGQFTFFQYEVSVIWVAINVFSLTIELKFLHWTNKQFMFVPFKKKQSKKQQHGNFTSQCLFHWFINSLWSWEWNLFPWMLIAKAWPPFFQLQRGLLGAHKGACAHTHTHSLRHLCGWSWTCCCCGWLRPLQPAVCWQQVSPVVFGLSSDSPRQLTQPSWCVAHLPAD